MFRYKTNRNFKGLALLSLCFMIAIMAFTGACRLDVRVNKPEKDGQWIETSNGKVCVKPGNECVTGENEIGVGVEVNY